MDCGWDGGQGGRLLEGNTKGWRVSRQHVYQTARWWRRWAERGRGGGEREAARWLQITVVSAAAFSRWRSVEEGRRGRVSQNMLANCHTHTDAHTCQHARTHSSAPSKISQAQKQISSFFIFNARADGGAAVPQEEEEEEKKLLA